MKGIYQKIQVVQATIGKIPKDSNNPFFKSNYFDINSLLEHLQPILHDVELVVIQPVIDGCVCTKIISVDTAEEVTSCMQLPDIQDPQKIGSAITYYRRYTLQSLLALQADDDDGNSASKVVNKPKMIMMTDAQFQQAMGWTQKQIEGVLVRFNGTNGKSMTTAQREQLTNKL